MLGMKLNTSWSRFIPCRKYAQIDPARRMDLNPSSAFSMVVIHLHSGRVITREMLGAPAPMTPVALERKFRELAAWGAPHCNADELLEALGRFPQMANAADLIAMTTPQS